MNAPGAHTLQREISQKGVPPLVRCSTCGCFEHLLSMTLCPGYDLGSSALAKIHRGEVTFELRYGLPETSFKGIRYRGWASPASCADMARRLIVPEDGYQAALLAGTEPWRRVYHGHLANHYAAAQKMLIDLFRRSIDPNADISEGVSSFGLPNRKRGVGFSDGSRIPA